MRAFLDRWAGRWENERGATWVLGLTRICFGVLLLWEVHAAFHALGRDGYFGDRFHFPYLPEALVPPRPVYVALLWTRAALAGLALLGILAGPALWGSAALGLYGLLCDRMQYHHNLYSLLCFTFLLGFTPCAQSFAVGAGVPPAPAKTGPLWAVRLAQLQLSIVYLASSGSKLLDPDWRAGSVLSGRLAHELFRRAAHHLPAFAADGLLTPGLGQLLATGAIATELFLAFGLWTRARPVALWWGSAFHLTIQATSNVQIFSWLTLATYTLFVTPDFRARTVRVDPARAWLRSALRGLDLFARFQVVAAPGPLTVIDRSGVRHTGARALRELCRALPILFPLWLPLATAQAAVKPPAAGGAARRGRGGATGPR